VRSAGQQSLTRSASTCLSRIAAVTGSPEFLAVSMDGHHLCAASAEEDDYWVVQHELS
jgi:hypothetical protein